MDLLGQNVRWPIVGAPMAGGPSTPALAAAVGEAGGLGFLAGGYLSGPDLGRQIAELRRLSAAPFGVNLFLPQSPDVDDAALHAYVEALRTEAEAIGVGVDASWDDDRWPEKLELLMDDPVSLVSFTFGCPPAPTVEDLQRVGTKVLVTVTTPEEAARAVEAGVDAVAAQGMEAGGHQGTFVDRTDPDTGWGLLSLLTAIRHEVAAVPVIAAGGLMTGSDVAAVVRAGAVAAQIGTALLRAPESGASPVYKAALADPAFTGTAVTRAFSGRRARGLVNDFMRTHPDAPSAYPQINNATRALRRAAVARGDPHGTNLWAGQGFRLAQARPAAEIVAALGAEFESRNA